MIVLQEYIEVSRPIHEAFAYISAFNTSQEWDSTVTRAEKLTAGPIALGTRFAVNCALPIGSIDIDYTVTHLQKDRVIELRGSSRFFDVSDRIQFTSTEKGTRIDYRAEFDFPSTLQALAKSFEASLQRMGKHSMQGLRAALESDYPAPSSTWSNNLADRFVLPGLAKFTRLGYTRSSPSWAPNSSYLGDKHLVITGASSGLGYTTAMELARRHAHITLVARNEMKGQGVVNEIIAETGNDQVQLEVADLSLMEGVARLVRKLRRRGKPIDVLVNNAGALFNPRQETTEGIEASLALLLLSPYRLAIGLKPLLVMATHARVINVVSGGMYSQKLDMQRLLNKEPPSEYSGSVAYARAKRALMIVTEELAKEWADENITVNAMHPGWADTPGVKSSLPEFYKLTRSFLRTPEQGADTIVWLASAREAGDLTGYLFLDRQPHTTHLLPFSRESEEEREALMAYLEGA